jgi:DMSO/TMAO reductase YedYZ molybdopterin-dependent catalytic subunit
MSAKFERIICEQVLAGHGSFSRRAFLQTSAATGVVVALAPYALQAAEPPIGPTANDLVPGKNPELIVHNSKTFEIETPLTLLREHNLTPIDILFVRNNQQPAWAVTLQPPAAQTWKLEITGLTEYPRVIELESLLKMPMVEHEMVLQCSGNGRKNFSRAAPAKGAQWDQGAVANVRFKGVPLRAVLEASDVRPHPSVRFLTAEGRDEPGTAGDADFEHSIPWADALDRSLLALELNGQPLPAIHGGPLRLVTPGYYGTMHLKWLSRLRLEAHETVNHHQVKRYRTPLHPIEPGSKFEYSLENSEPNWNMRIKSVIFSPLDGEQVSAGRLPLSGVAWNDGQAKIEAVELSRDAGLNWQRAKLRVPSSRYAWYPWQSDFQVEQGQHTFLCRAVDALGRTQPLDGSIDWNPAGYGWHGVQSISVTVR